MFKEREDNFSFDLLLSISKETNILFQNILLLFRLLKNFLFFLHLILMFSPFVDGMHPHQHFPLMQLPDRQQMQIPTG
jgi:hypothetical protein